jgi:hypothetical protein
MGSVQMYGLHVAFSRHDKWCLGSATKSEKDILLYAVRETYIVGSSTVVWDIETMRGAGVSSVIYFYSGFKGGEKHSRFAFVFSSFRAC